MAAKELFACKDRHGKLIGTSETIAGAMAKAPKDNSYAIVRGEFTSDGMHWPIGFGRQCAVRELGRWQVG